MRYKIYRNRGRRYGRNKRYKIFRNPGRKYKYYKRYKGHSKYDGSFEYDGYLTRIAVLNEYADNKDRKGFLAYINTQPARRSLFNCWKNQRRNYEEKRDIDMANPYF